ncbi:hypothetical protein GUJ93_ZPchr0001g32046 [Zizania palustris]|uniref:Uncharacterized protein n=1 Tax=Zizania palustris TaxID=103762 RepID=A0A8J5RRY1_ZIZPA|nr:hypothetical protein GUJ93_ZPchr0001g32046 [Zizania palustris]
MTALAAALTGLLLALAAVAEADTDAADGNATAPRPGSVPNQGDFGGDGRFAAGKPGSSRRLDARYSETKSSEARHFEGYSEWSDFRADFGEAKVIRLKASHRSYHTPRVRRRALEESKTAKADRVCSAKADVVSSAKLTKEASK